MALQVIGAGFGRTGTLSLKAALEKLGYQKCHHMTEVFSSGKQIDQWHAIGQGGDPDWDAVFDGYQASVDFPSSIYWRPLAAEYPDAKVILTTRSPDSWYSSATDTIYAIGKAFPAWMKRLPRVRKLTQMVEKIIWHDLFDDRFEDKEHACQVFNDHLEAVRSELPAERLLVFQVQEGWEPLCRFLDRPIPDEPFPHVNDKFEFETRIRMLRRLRFVPHSVVFLSLFLVLIAAWKYAT